MRKTVDCCAQHIRTKIKGTDFSVLTLHSPPPRKIMDEASLSSFTRISKPKGEVYWNRDESREWRLCPLKKKWITLQNNMHEAKLYRSIVLSHNQDSEKSHISYLNSIKVWPKIKELKERQPTQDFLSFLVKAKQAYFSTKVVFLLRFWMKDKDENS